MATKPIKSNHFAAFNEISATCFTPKINIMSQKFDFDWAVDECLLPMKLIIVVINFFFVTRLQLYVHNYVRLKSQEKVHVESGV